jgi:CRISPR/Cas system-associated exonuclease Cas4 (RecB family)
LNWAKLLTLNSNRKVKKLETSRFLPKNSRSKAAYAYWLTSAGFEEKVRLTVAFLARKRREYEILEKEIAELQQEVRELETTPSPLSRNGSR